MQRNRNARRNRIENRRSLLIAISVAAALSSDNGSGPPHVFAARRPIAGAATQIYDVAMRSLGRMLQLLGLIVLPCAILIELTGALGRDFGTRGLFVSLLFGAAAFYLGRFVEGYAAR